MRKMAVSCIWHTNQEIKSRRQKGNVGSGERDWSHS